jgi:predicted ATPase with chaperone activity
MIRRASSAMVPQRPPGDPADKLDAKDFAYIKGQEACKRAFTIALAGNHPICAVGRPGQGKTMLIEAAKAVDPTLQTHEVRLWFPYKDDLQRRKHVAERLWGLAQHYDIHIEVPDLPFRELASRCLGTPTARVREQADSARQFAADHPKLPLDLSDSCLLLMRQAFEELGLTPRAYDAARRVARTIANMEHAEHIGEHHLAEAVQYRLFDRRF